MNLRRMLARACLAATNPSRNDVGSPRGSAVTSATVNVLPTEGRGAEIGL